MDLIEACRTCLQYDDYMSSIYEPIAIESDSPPISPIDLFRMIPRLNITQTDRFPSNICSKCLDDILHIYAFILKSERTTKMLIQQSLDIKLETIKPNGLSSNNKSPSTSADYYSPRTSKSGVECIPCFDLTSDSASECDLEVTPDIPEFDEPYEIGPSSSKTMTTRTIIIGDKPKTNRMHFDNYAEDIKPNINEIGCGSQSKFSNSCEPLLREIKKEDMEIGEETIYDPNFDLSEQDIKQEPVDDTGYYAIPKFRIASQMKNVSRPKIILQKRNDSFEKISCMNCEQEFKSLQERDRHMDLCLPLIECGICSEIFQDDDSVAVHFITAHPGEKPICTRTDGRLMNNSTNGGGGFQCPDCPKSFATERRLEGHLKVHSQRHVCVPCNKSFRTKHHLKCHLVRKHQDTWKKIICGVCDLRFACKADLLRHQLKHTKEKPYKCSQCPNTYGYKKVLADHMRQFHNRTEDEIQTYLKENYSKALHKYLDSHFQCYVCAAMVNRDDLAPHMISHRKFN